MKKLLTWMAVLFFLTGCTSSTYQKLVSPSESLYFEGNKAFEQKDFSKAIEKYELFLENYPRSPLATPAKLNLGMSYYYEEEKEKAYTILSVLKIQDKKIQIFIKNILQELEIQLAKDTKKEANTIVNGGIHIQVTRAQVDDFGSLIITGKIDKPAASVFINDNKIRVTANQEFSATIYWKRGKQIVITAQDDIGNSGELVFYPDSEPPQEPTGLQAGNLTDNSAELDWNDNDEEDIKGYKIFYNLKGGSRQEVAEIIKKSEYEIVGLNNLIAGTNRTFQFYIKAVDRMENYSSSSLIIEATLP